MSAILVIDDDEIMRSVIRNILVSDGFSVTTATAGDTIFDVITEGRFEIVITDLLMPHINGLEIVNRLRSGADGRSVGIIVFSSLDNDGTVTEAFRLGADKFIKKPIIAEELLTAVHTLIASKNDTLRFVTKRK